MQNPTATAHYPTIGPQERLSFLVAIAALLHLAVILGINFIPEDSPAMSKGLEVTLASVASTTAPEEADYLAQVNQQGSGTLEHAALPTTDVAPLISDSEVNEVQLESSLAPRLPVEASTPVISTLHERAQKVQTQTPSKEQPNPGRPAPILDRDQLAMEIASLEAEYNELRQISAKRPRISRQNTLSAKGDITAWYRDAWRKHVERIGNLNYPDEARRKGIYGSLRLRVILRNDGSIAEIEVTESSGQPILDQAAQRIVRLSAPFSPFTGEMAANFDQIEIIRTWRFGRNDYLSSH